MTENERLTGGLRSLKLKEGSSSRLRDAIVEHVEWAYAEGEKATLRAVGERLAEEHERVKGVYTETCSICRFAKSLNEGKLL